MDGSIDDLVLRWKQSPNPAATIALCNALRGSLRVALIQQVGEFSTQRHANDVGVLVAVSRMYLDARRYAEAQGVLVGAGKVAPREPEIYRWLGEVLLRRGDAERAEKVLERALQLGTRDGDARLWLERARVFKPMQAKAGARAVAAEVEHATVSSAAGAPPPREPMESFGDTTTLVREVPPAVRDSARGPSASGASLENGKKPSFVSAPHLAVSTGASMFDVPGESATNARGVGSSGASFEPTFPKDAETYPAAFESPGVAIDPSSPDEVSVTSDLLATNELPARPPSNRPAPRKPSSRPPPLPLDAMPPSPRVAPPAPRAPAFDAPRAPAFDAPRAAFDAPRAPSGDAHAPPHPRDVLDALALAGVFEPPNAASLAAAAWDRPERGPIRRRAQILTLVATFLLVGGGIGTFFYVQNRRAKAHLEAEKVLATIETDMAKGRPELLPAVEKSIGGVFELESRSPRAALAWLRERALVGLLKGGADVAFEDAMMRAKEVGVTEDKVAFAQLGSFLFQGDTAGAAGLLSKLDPKAQGDAWYQLMAGATLERAGDARARDRYAAAAKIDPTLYVAEVALARSTSIDGDPAAATELAKQLRAKYPDRVEGVALVALAWGRDPARGEQAPPEAEEVVARAGELPVSLKFVPHAVSALRAVDKRQVDDAKKHITAGLAAADGPGVAAWIGSIAITAGDEPLARKAALAAVSFSAVYPPARVLAARVALFADRLDEALKATEELEPSSPDVAVVRAAAAYERVDADGLARALEAVPPEGRKLPFLQPLALGVQSIGGRAGISPKEIVDMSDDEAPWADLVAMDLALDRGDLDSADAIAKGWKGGEGRPLRELRLARLARYKNDLDGADRLSLSALQGGTVTPRVLWERAVVLVARGKFAEVGPLLGKFPLVLGPLATWINAYALASGGKVDDAKGKTSSLDPPPAGAPYLARVIAAAAFGAMKDKKRGVDYVAQLLASAPQSPDLVAAATTLGFKKVEKKGKPAGFDAP